VRAEHARLSMQTKDPPKRGRSSGYDAEIAETIFNRLVNRESLRAICADPAMPAKATVSAGSAAIRNFAVRTPSRAIARWKT
jgi:hypothetical protein